MPGVPSRGLLRVVVVAVTLSSASLVTASQGSAQDALPVSESEALRVLEEHVEKNEQNNATLDIEGQGAIEAPPLRTIDDALFREYQGRGETTLGETTTIDDLDVFIPDQSRYPLMFLASETFTSPDSPDRTQQLLLFVKPTEDDPWRTTMAAQLLGEMPELDIDEFGLARLVGPKAAAKLEVKPSQLSKKLASLWTRTLDEPLPASATFEPSLLTTAITQLLVFSLEKLDLPETNVEFEFKAAENQPVCFGAEGGAFCFFVMSIRESLEPVTGRFEQPDSRDVLGGLIPPGDYGGAQLDRLAILAGFVPNRARNELVQVIGLYEGLVRAEGTPGRASAPAV